MFVGIEQATDGMLQDIFSNLFPDVRSRSPADRQPQAPARQSQAPAQQPQNSRQPQAPARQPQAPARQSQAPAQRAKQQRNGNEAPPRERDAMQIGDASSRNLDSGFTSVDAANLPDDGGDPYSGLGTY